MQNRYLLDTGDFSKFKLIKEFGEEFAYIGLNWYMCSEETERNESKKDKAGKHKGYLDDINNKDSYLKKISTLRIPSENYKNIFKYSDPVLYSKMQRILVDTKVEDLSINLIKSNNIFKENVIFFEERINENREQWFENSKEKLINTEIIFCDPDNGFSHGTKCKEDQMSKYVFFKEVKNYLEIGHSVIVYQHLTRNDKRDIQCQKRIDEINKECGQYFVETLYSGRGTGRFYFVIYRNEHKDKIDKILCKIKNTDYYGKKKLFELYDKHVLTFF